MFISHGESLWFLFFWLFTPIGPDGERLPKTHGIPTMIHTRVEAIEITSPSPSTANKQGECFTCINRASQTWDHPQTPSLVFLHPLHPCSKPSTQPIRYNIIHIITIFQCVNWMWTNEWMNEWMDERSVLFVCLSCLFACVWLILREWDPSVYCRSVFHHIKLSFFLVTWYNLLVLNIVLEYNDLVLW